MDSCAVLGRIWLAVSTRTGLRLIHRADPSVKETAPVTRSITLRSVVSVAKPSRELSTPISALPRTQVRGFNASRKDTQVKGEAEKGSVTNQT